MKSGRRGITKEQSAMLQGVAILFMIYHHFFSEPEIYGGSLHFWNDAFVTRLAWFGKICVGLFAFVSGYGMSRVLDRYAGGVKGRREEQGIREIFGEFRTCISKAWRLVMKFWIVLSCFMAFYFLTGRRIFDLKEFLMNLFCIRTSYNGSFWYVEQYGKMLLLLPLIQVFLDGLRDGAIRRNSNAPAGEKSDEKKLYVKSWMGLYGALAVFFLIAIVCGGSFEGFRLRLLWLINCFRPAFFLVFLVGYGMARYRAYELAFQLFERFPKLLSGMSGMMLVGVVLALRIGLADSAAYAKLDFLFVPVFVLGMCLVMDLMPHIRKALGWLGSMSVWMWLIHLFIYDLTKDMILSVVSSHMLFYLLEVFLSVLAAMGCAWIQKGIGRLRNMQKRPGNG